MVEWLIEVIETRRQGRLFEDKTFRMKLTDKKDVMQRSALKAQHYRSPRIGNGLACKPLVWVSHNKPRDKDWVTGSLYGRSLHEAPQKKWRKWARGEKCQKKIICYKWAITMDNEDLLPLGCGPWRNHLEFTSGSSYLRAGRLGHTPAFSYIPLATYSSWVLTPLHF